MKTDPEDLALPVSIESLSPNIETDSEAVPNTAAAQTTVMGILVALSVAHLLNDTIQ